MDINGHSRNFASIPTHEFAALDVYRSVGWPPLPPDNGGESLLWDFLVDDRIHDLESGQKIALEKHIMGLNLELARAEALGVDVALDYWPDILRAMHLHRQLCRIAGRTVDALPLPLTAFQGTCYNIFLVCCS